MEMLEDNHADILTKAMVGQLIPVNQAAEKIGESPKAVRAVVDGAVDLEIIRKLAAALNLAPDALCTIAEGNWQPNVTIPKGVFRIETEFRGGFVNAYVAHDTKGNAIIVDTGMDASPLIEVISRENLKIKAIFITHGHTDHVFALEGLRAKYDVPVYAIGLDEIRGIQKLRYGEGVNVNGMGVEIIRTVGHASDGASFLISGLEKPIVFPGDALFAGSMGGGMVSYRQALETTGANLLPLNAATVVCPGHGPITTIGLERVYNAFFGE